MHSGGGIMRLPASVKRAASLVESGPAAGVIACARLVCGARRGANFISFDMGGTTAKAALIENGESGANGRIRGRRRDQPVEQARQRRRIPDQDAIHRRVGDRRRRWQHRSLDGWPRHGRSRERRSHPGPVCYGRGGTRATLTDVFVTLGYINNVALAGGSIKVDAQAAGGRCWSRSRTHSDKRSNKAQAASSRWRSPQ